jgi:hypothetical protein
VSAFVAGPPPGGPAIASVTAALAGASPAALPLAPAANGQWTAEATVDPTLPGDHQDVTATVTVTDAAGRTAQAQAKITVHDPRPVIVPATSPVLLFAGTRRPDGSAELDLEVTVPAIPADVTWRLYVTDEYAGGAAGAGPRWQRAAQLRATVTTRDAMALLPASAAQWSGAKVRIRHRLSGRLRTVHLFQLVAVTGGGADAPTASCGVFTAAVPYDDAPPPPWLTASVDPKSPRIVTLNAVLSYPGQRDAVSTPPGPIVVRGGDPVPVARLRRTAAGAPAAAAVTLPRVVMVADHPADPGAGWRWRATWTDQIPATAPGWAPLTYWAEVAWPDEPAWDPNAAPVFGEVRPTWQDPASQPSAWSPPSNAVHVVAPESAPAVASAWALAPDRRTATITVTVPAAHVLAPPWRVSAVAAGQVEQHTDGPGPVLMLAGLAPTAGNGAAWTLAVSTPGGDTLPLIHGDGTPV